jgi:hypothetical protein
VVRFDLAEPGRFRALGSLGLASGRRFDDAVGLDLGFGG